MGMSSVRDTYMQWQSTQEQYGCGVIVKGSQGRVTEQQQTRTATVWLSESVFPHNGAALNDLCSGV